MDNKITDGMNLVKQAEKSLRTNLLRWKPDYDSAAEKFQQAGICFKNAKALPESKSCFMKAADCHEQRLSLFHSAKCLDQVVLISKELNEFEELSEIGLRASFLFLQCGTPEAAVNSLEKAGKVIEAAKPQEALRCYQRAAEILKNEDNTRQAATYLNRAARLMVKLKMYDKAADAIINEIRMHEENNNVALMGRVLVGLILVHLVREDFVAAEKALRQWGSYCEPPEKTNLENLVRAYDDGDSETIKKCLEHSFIRHMDVEFAKLARSMAEARDDPESKRVEAQKLKEALMVHGRQMAEQRRAAMLSRDEAMREREEAAASSCRQRRGKAKLEEPEQPKVEDDDDDELC